MCICLHISYREYNSVNKKLVSCRISYFIPCKSDACRCLCFLIFKSMFQLVHTTGERINKIFAGRQDGK